VIVIVSRCASANLSACFPPSLGTGFPETYGPCWSSGGCLFLLRKRVALTFPHFLFVLFMHVLSFNGADPVGLAIPVLVCPPTLEEGGELLDRRRFSQTLEWASPRFRFAVFPLLRRPFPTFLNFLPFVPRQRNAPLRHKSPYVPFGFSFFPAFHGGFCATQSWSAHGGASSTWGAALATRTFPPEPAS